MAVPREWGIAAMSAAIVAGLVSTSIWAAGSKWWPFADEEASALVGGCAPFNLYGQNQFQPYGTNTRAEPSPSAEVVGGFSPNELVTVDGWVRTRTPYPTNTPPWNSDAWFHLANDQGWVPFAAVRAVPTSHDPDNGFGPGSDPAPLDEECAGSIRS